MELTRFCTLCLLCLGIFLRGALAGSNCTTGYQTVEYCEHGCCYDNNDDSTNYYDYYANCCVDPALVGIIVGAVLGGLALIAIVVVIIICCALKKKGQVGCGGKMFGGRTNQTVTQQQPQTTSTGYNNYSSYGAQPYPTGTQPYPNPPPQYSMGTMPQQYPPGPPPNAGIYNDPVYPPSGAPPPYGGSGATGYAAK